MIRGVRKNAFAVIEYRISALLIATLAAVVVNIWPFVAIWITHGATQILYATAALVMVAMYATSAAFLRNRPWLAPLYPVAAAISLYMLWAAVLRTIILRGISWRDTFYPLSALKKNRV